MCKRIVIAYEKESRRRKGVRIKENIKCGFLLPRPGGNVANAENGSHHKLGNGSMNFKKNMT